MDLAEAAPLVVEGSCRRRRKGEVETLVGVRVVVGFVDGGTHRGKGECQRRRDVSDRIGGGVGELDNHQNSRQYLRESRERSAPVTTADCLHEVSSPEINAQLDSGAERKRARKVLAT